ncbi:Gifsy-2 prophage protein [Olavius sp. associated proteobacterium Delta 1]|nr:Gifsy-2 prophage protein [Olavius sp. associated proteobacterium Delta 1]
MSAIFSGYRNLEELIAFFPIDNAAGEVTPNLDVAPAQEIWAIIQDGAENRLDKFHWGLVPFWAKDVSIGNRMINARAETIAEKQCFREAFKSRRCLIPADGFYEWKTKKGMKQPVFITLPDRKPFAFAGLWETWQKTDDTDSLYKSCTIITTRASESFSSIHHRMPVILKPQVYDKWLDPGYQNAVELVELLQNDIITELESFALEKQTGSAHHIDPSRTEAVGKAQQTTFDWPELRETSREE